MRLRWTAAVFAAGLLAAPAAWADQLRLSYAVYFAGLHVADLQAGADLRPAGYAMTLGFQMTGAVGAIFSGGGESRADGRFQGTAALPRQLFSSGQMRGKARVTQIDYRGDQPVVVKLEPPLEPEREAVSPEQQANSIDSLSAMAALLHRVAATGRCEGDARIFDGRWLSSLDVRTVGEEQLPATGRSPYAGVALRCDITGQQLAGFTRDADPAVLHRPHHATVWFARVTPGGPPVPIRISIETRGFGEATLYLTAAA